jgi:hypothetical protein
MLPQRPAKFMPAHYPSPKVLVKKYRICLSTRLQHLVEHYTSRKIVLIAAFLVLRYVVSIVRYQWVPLWVE